MDGFDPNDKTPDSERPDVVGGAQREADGAAKGEWKQRQIRIRWEGGWMGNGDEGLLVDYERALARSLPVPGRPSPRCTTSLPALCDHFRTIKNPIAPACPMTSWSSYWIVSAPCSQSSTAHARLQSSIWIRKWEE